MKMISNEKKYAKECLVTHHLDKKPSKTLNILVRYWYLEGHTQDEILVLLDKYMKKADGEYNRNKWRDMFKRIVKANCNENCKLNEFDRVSITDGEKNAIMSVKGKELQKILFSMLVHCKVNNIINNNDSNWITVETKDIFSAVGVSRGNEKKELMLADLADLGLIRFSYKTLAIELHYIDRENNDEAIIIDDFNNLQTFYHKMVGGKVIECAVCGKLVLVQGKANTNARKYCSECSKIKHNESAREYKRRKGGAL